MSPPRIESVNRQSEAGPVVIVGAGPAGLAAAHELVSRNVSPVVLEKGSRVGGLARTESFGGFLVDIGGHRFFSKDESINRLWEDMLGDDFLTVPRKSRIHYKGKFFDYPFKLQNALSNLGFTESFRILASYIDARFRPIRNEETFEEWVSNRFGRRLYGTFFKTYTEKVWGIPCTEIDAKWAAQRIRGLSLIAAISHSVFGSRTIKTLIHEFRYPALGPGMMWRRFQEVVEAGSGRVRLNSEVVQLHHSGGRIDGVRITENGRPEEIRVGSLLSSMPVNLLIEKLDPPAPESVREAARRLSYRDFLIVLLVVDKSALFPDQWLYIHSPDVGVARIQNFKNWSRAMVPDPRKTSVGMEYFCTAGDPVWSRSDKDLIGLATKELVQLGFAAESDFSSGYVIRQPNAYPIYDRGYRIHLEKIRRYLETFHNLETIGRSGLHRYNNMDHSMQTGILAARNIMGSAHGIWEIHTDEDYLEEERMSPERIAAERLLSGVLLRLDPFAFASAVGIVSGTLLFAATLWLVIKGGPVVGPNLRLLSEYFVGYTVSLKGSFIAFGYSLFWGFLFGWLFAYLRNLFFAIYIYRIRQRASLFSLKDFLDYL